MMSLLAKVFGSQQLVSCNNSYGIEAGEKVVCVSFFLFALHMKKRLTSQSHLVNKTK